MPNINQRRPIDTELQLEFDRLMQESGFQSNPSVIRNIAKKNIQYTERMQEIVRREKMLARKGWSNRPLEKKLEEVLSC